MSTIDFELDSNLDWLECSVASIELTTTKNEASKHKSDKKFIWSAEVVEKIRVARARQTNLGMRGKTQSEETRKKISDANRGRIVSEETRQKRRVSNLGKIHSEETKQKISDAKQKHIRIFVTPMGTFVGKAELKKAGLRYETILTRIKKSLEGYYYGN
jgi:hypothetical protein